MTPNPPAERTLLDQLRCPFNLGEQERSEAELARLLTLDAELAAADAAAVRWYQATAPYATPEALTQALALARSLETALADSRAECERAKEYFSDEITKRAKRVQQAEQSVLSLQSQLDAETEWRTKAEADAAHLHLQLRAAWRLAANAQRESDARAAFYATDVNGDKFRASRISKAVRENALVEQEHTPAIESAQAAGKES